MEDSVLLFGQGQPIKEPVMAFVMNTTREIRAAISDTGKFGA